MSKRSRKRRRRERERYERQHESTLVCVERSDWRTLYRVVPRPSPEAKGYAKGYGHRKALTSVPAPEPDRATGSYMECLLRSLGWTDTAEPAVAAPLSDINPAARKSDDGAEEESTKPPPPWWSSWTSWF